MTDYHELRKKYPKWAHRKDEHRKRRRKSRRKRRRAKRKKEREKQGSTSTEGMLLSLLHQLMLGGTLAKKHGENVITGYADKVDPNALAPVRSRYLMREAMAEPQQQGGAGAGAGAVAAFGPVMPGPPAS
jgi:hypothetical protein